MVAQIATGDKGKERPVMDQLLLTNELPLQSTVGTGDALFAVGTGERQVIDKRPV